MLNIAQRMREIIDCLREEGFEGFSFPEAQVECDDQWSERYAIAQGMKWDSWDIPDHVSDRVDWSELEYDFLQWIKSRFSEGSGEPVVLLRNFEDKRDKDVFDEQKSQGVDSFILIRHNAYTQEIEVYRLNGQDVLEEPK